MTSRQPNCFTMNMGTPTLLLTTSSRLLRSIYLVLHGQRPPRIHELDTLLALATRFQADLYPSFVDLCERVSRYYIEGRYPPGPPAEYRRDEIKADLDQAWQLIRRIGWEIGRMGG